jgi:hypothetical protein
VNEPLWWESRLALAREATAEVRRAAREGPPPEPLPDVDWRSIGGFPGYWIDRFRVVWTARGRNGLPCPWRPVIVLMRGRNGTTACVRLRDPGGRQRFANVAKLHRAAWLYPSLPEGDPGLESIEDID